LRYLLLLGNVVLPVGGDVLVAVDGQTVRNEQEFTVYLETRTAIGQVVQVTVVRGEQQMTVPITPGEAGHE
jgi:S1-C subfamily serine protease